MENNNKLSVTPLTDDEVNEFNEEVERSCFLQIRNDLKDALDVILITVNYFCRHFPSDVGHPDLSADDLSDSIATAISTAMLQVDEMDATELAKIAEHTNYVYDAFKLVEPYLPDGVLPRNYQPLSEGLNSPRAGYLRKICDILHILSISAMQYKGSDVGYISARYLKNRLVEYPGGKALCGSLTPDDPGYVIYNNKPFGQSSAYPAIVSTLRQLRQWSDENLDDNCKDKFFAFVMRHEADIYSYIKIKALYNPLSREISDELCTFFYRWFLKEQADK